MQIVSAFQSLRAVTGPVVLIGQNDISLPVLGVLADQLVDDIHRPFLIPSTHQLVVERHPPGALRQKHAGGVIIALDRQERGQDTRSAIQEV